MKLTVGTQTPERTMTKPNMTDQRWVRTFIKNVGRRKFKRALLLAQQGQHADAIATEVQIPLEYAKEVIRKIESNIVAK